MKKVKGILNDLVTSRNKKILVSKEDAKVLCESIKPDIEVDGKKYKVLKRRRSDKVELSLK